MDWKRIGDNRYTCRVGKIDIKICNVCGWYIVLEYPGARIMPNNADYSSTQSAKRAALRWAKRLQDGLK